jgi:zinc protease
MKRTTLTALLMACFLAPLPSAVAQTPAWKQIQILQLPSFKPQQPKRIELSNGMVIFLQEDHELPFVGGTARIRGGSVN